MSNSRQRTDVCPHVISLQDLVSQPREVVHPELVLPTVDTHQHVDPLKDFDLTEASPRNEREDCGDVEGLMSWQESSTCKPFPWPLLSSSKRPLSVPTRRLTPHRAPHRISPLNFRLYLRISGDCKCEQMVWFTQHSIGQTECILSLTTQMTEAI